MKVTSQTQAAFPSNKSRTRLGLGELVDVTCSTGAADWTLSQQSGSLSATNGTTVTYTASMFPGSVTITATANGATASITFTIVAPSGATWVKIGSSESQAMEPGSLDIQYEANVFIQPADVSFEHIQVRELQSSATGNGCYAATIANATANGAPVQHQHGGEGQSLNPVQQPTSDSSGSKVSQTDTIGANVLTSKICNGGWSFSIPMVYGGGGLSETRFGNPVQQVVTVTPGSAPNQGSITVAKGGSSATDTS